MRKLVLAVAVTAVVFILLIAGGGSIQGQTAPTITAINPPNAGLGSTINITGSGFTFGTQVLFTQGGTTTSFLAFVLSSTSLCVPIPFTLATGSVTIAVSAAGGPSTGVPYTIGTTTTGEPAACTATVTPTSGPAAAAT